MCDSVQVRRTTFFSNSNAYPLPHNFMFFKSLIDNNLLMEIMEIREEIADASTYAELKPLLEECHTKQTELYEQLADAFQNDKVDNARYLTAKLQYWNRIEEKIAEKISSWTR